MKDSGNNRFQKINSIEKSKSTPMPLAAKPQSRLSPQRNFSGLFRGWFNNRMTVLLMILQNPRSRPPQTMQRVEFFLEEIEHHFIDAYAPRPVRNAFRYLERYFRIYPAVSEMHCRRALAMTARIYQALGMTFKFHPEADEIPFFKKQNTERAQAVFCRGMSV